MLERVATHGVRRAAEMREVARTVDQLGLDGAMARATTEWQQRVGDLGLSVSAIEDAGYGALADAILAALADQIDGPRPAPTPPSSRPPMPTEDTSGVITTDRR